MEGGGKRLGNHPTQELAADAVAEAEGTGVDAVAEAGGTGEARREKDSLVKGVSYYKRTKLWEAKVQGGQLVLPAQYYPTQQEAEARVLAFRTQVEKKSGPRAGRWRPGGWSSGWAPPGRPGSSRGGGRPSQPA